MAFDWGERSSLQFGSQSVEISAELALHFERGGDPERALGHLTIAAAGVRKRAGDREAVAYFEHALALLATLPESAERDRREIELRMHLWREANSMTIFSAMEQYANLDRTLELCDRTADAHSRAYATSYRTRSLIMKCELDAAESVDEQRVAHASALGDSMLLGAAHSEVGDIALFRGELDRAQREYALCRNALESADPLELTRLLSHDPGTMSVGRLGWVHWLQGRPDEARRDAAACLARAEAIGYAVNSLFAPGFALLVELFRRDVGAVNALAKLYRKHAAEYGFDLPYPAVYAELSWPLAQSGEHDAAVALLQQGLSVRRRTGVRQESGPLFAVLAETELARGRAKQGLAVIEEARTFVKETGERFWEAEIHRLEGELLLLEGEEERAEACFARALDVASGQGALSLELRAATSLARLQKDQGREQEARPLLAAVYDRFSEGFDTADLQGAKSLLGSL